MSPDDSSRRPGLLVAVVGDAGRPVRAPGLAAWLTRVAPARARGAVTVAIVTDARVRALNRAHRGIDRPTDVLSFPTEDSGPRTEPSPPARQGAARHIGDIVIAEGVAARQAREAGHSVSTEWRVLALHGLLHLLGHDHEDPSDAGRMRRIEARLRRKGGLAAGLIEREAR